MARMRSQPSGPVVTGLESGGTRQSVKVFMNSVEKGTLPLESQRHRPGIRETGLEGGGRYNRTRARTPSTSFKAKSKAGRAQLKVLKGQVAIELTTDNPTNVTLLRTDSKIEKKLREHLEVAARQVRVQPGRDVEVVATKKGYDDFTQDVSFDDGNAETIRVELTEKGKAASASAAATTAPRRGHVDHPGAGENHVDEHDAASDKSASAATPPDKGATGTGTLNIKLDPCSKVVLDGRATGSGSPKMASASPAGSHTVTFIHPEKGKKSVTVQVKAGEAKTTSHEVLTPGAPGES